MKALDTLGMELGTDKSRLRNDYLRSYERVMSPDRNAPITLVEIGVHTGASLKTWEKYFPNARIIGVDIEPTVKRLEHGRIKIEIGSQYDGEFIQRIMTAYSPNIIIDDGSHINEHQIFTFEKAFPLLLPGGLYVVEDIAYSSEPGSAAEYFACLQRDLLLARSTDQIRSIETIRGAVIIRKSTTDSLDGDFDALELIVARFGHPDALFHLAEYIRKSGTSPERALAIAAEASSANPDNGWVVLEISYILEQQKRIPEALSEAVRASQIITKESGFVPTAFTDQIDRLRLEQQKNF